MKICKLIIPEFRQFQNFELDLTYPKGHKKEGQPLEKICFIGSNGTGKSTLLNLIRNSLKEIINFNKVYNSDKIILKLKTDEDIFYFQAFSNDNIISRMYDNDNSKYYELRKKHRGFLLNENIEKLPNWINIIKKTYNNIEKYLDNYNQNNYFYKNQDFFQSFLNNPNENLLIYSPPEVSDNQLIGLNDVPSVTLNEALELFKNFKNYYQISHSSSDIKEFWKLLIYLVKKREKFYLEFQNLEENQNKTMKDIKEEFNKNNPEILKEISELWNKILEKVGLEFDYKNAIIPTQLNENLMSYIKLKSTKENLKYSDLSTGIRNYIFRIGFIYSLYFNRKIDNGFLLIDEPENSLYPDFLYDLIEDYWKAITQNNSSTQFFVATHNPIIATQFEPEERFILKFDDEGKVIAHRGTTPIGDDPNDILIKDFAVRNILGKEGLEKWERFVELKVLIKQTDDEEKKEILIDEYLKIGSEYNFSIKK